VNRSEETSPTNEEVDPETGASVRVGRSRRDDVEFNELDVRLRISYKTLVLVFVLFDVFHKVANAVYDSNVVQNFL